MQWTRAGLALAAVVLLVLVALVAFGTAQSLAYYQLHRERLYERARLPDLLDRGDLRTGDLLLFDAHSFNPIIKWTTLSPYSHVGVVVMLPARGARGARGARVPYIAESSEETTRYSVGRRMGDGTSLRPLVPRLRDYSGRAFVARLSRPLSPPAERALVAEASAHRPFARSLDQTLTFLGLRSRPLSTHCFQHACAMLNAARLPQTPLPETGLFSPARMLSYPEDVPLRGNAYRPAVELQL